MNMKKKLILPLIICLALALCACSAATGGEATPVPTAEASAEPEITPEPTAEASAEPEATEEPAPDYDAQIALILENQSLWDQTAEEYSEYDRYSYAVTDLDGNGRLEIFAAITQGSGIFTTGRVYEVGEGLDSLAQCSLPNEYGDIPEVIFSSVQKFTDAGSGENYYIVYDSVRAGAAENGESTNALSLKDGTLTISELGYVHRLYTAEGDSVTEDIHYYGADGAEITEGEYLSLAADRFAGFTGSAQSLGWFTLNDGSAADLLPLSWQVFSGELAAMPTEAPSAVCGIVN